MSTLRAESDLVKGLLAGTWHSGCTEKTLMLHAFSLMDLIICSPKSFIASLTPSLPACPEHPTEWFHLATLFLPPFLSSPFPSTPALCPISARPCHCLLGYKGWKLVDPINKYGTQLRRFPPRQSHTITQSRCPELQKTCKNSGLLDNNGGSLLQASLW